MKREFYYQDDRSNKFWSIELIGHEYVTLHGRVGAKARETRKTFPDEDTARRGFEKQIAAKLKKGYIEGNAPDYEKPDWASMSMSEDVFWRIIGLFNWQKTGDDDAVLRPAVMALAAMDEEAIVKFEDILSEKLHSLDTREHCRACYAGELDPDDGDDYISADDFLYSRCVVVANGRDFYASVVSDPTAMPQDLEFEALLSLPESAFERKTGKPYEHVSPVSYESFQNTVGWSPSPDTRPGKFTGPSIPPGNRRPT